MPDPHRIERELHEIYSKPEYSSLFDHKNRFEIPARHVTPQSLAKRIARSIFNQQAMVDPVYVEDVRGAIEFYRTYDGLSSEQGTAMTLGGYWCSRAVVEQIWQATAKLSGQERQEFFMDVMRSANFIHPSWNQMSDIACMRVPAGARVAIVRGRGNWKAMRTNRPGAKKPLYPKPPHPFNNPQVESVDDVLYSLGTMPIPGVEQLNVPLYNDMWVSKVPKLSPAWPLA
jgi:hypothetical protein